VQPAEATIWTDPPHTGIVHRLINTLVDQVHVIGVGGPRDTAVDRLARAAGCDVFDDPRKLQVDKPAAYWLVASHQPPSPADIAHAASAGTVILSLQPVAHSLRDLSAILGGLGAMSGRSSAKRHQVANRLIHPGLLASQPGGRSAGSLRERLAGGRSIGFRSAGPAHLGSLAMRLLDGWTSVLQWSDLPETVNAACTGRPATDPLPAATTGHIATIARLPAGQAACLRVGLGHDLAPQLTVQDDRRLLHATGHTCRLTGPPLHEDQDDITPPPPAPQAGTDEDTELRHAQLIADVWRDLITGRSAVGSDTGGDAMQRLVHAVACLETTALSLRTGTSESPRRLLEMQR
jgi:hypothetical protein